MSAPPLAAVRSRPGRLRIWFQAIRFFSTLGDVTAVALLLLVPLWLAARRRTAP